MDNYFLFLLFGWVLGAVIVAVVFGSDRTIGFWAVFFISIVFTPIIGFISAVTSETKDQEACRNEMLALQKQQAKSLAEIKDKLMATSPQ